MSLGGGARFPVLPISPDGLVSEDDLLTAQVLDVDEAIAFGDIGLEELRLPSGRRVSVHHVRPFSEVRRWQVPPIVSFSREELVVAGLICAQPDDLLGLVAIGSPGDLEVERADWTAHGAVVSVFDRSPTPMGLLMTQLRGQSALARTQNKLPTYYAMAPFGASATVIQVVADGGPTFQECVDFWNMRALRPGEEALSLILRESDLRDAEVRRNLAQDIEKYARSSPAVILRSASVSAQRLVAFRRSMGISTHRGNQWTEHLGGRNRDALTGVVNVNPIPLWQNSRESYTHLSAVDHYLRGTSTCQPC